MNALRPARLGAAAALAVAAPVAIGIGYIALRAFADPASARGYSATRLLRVLAEPVLVEAVIWSLVTAGVATLLALGAAVATAVLLRGQTRLERVARAVAVLPLPVPHLVAAALGVLLLAESGLAMRLLVLLGVLPDLKSAPELLYDRLGIGTILVLAWKEFPFLALLASAVLAQRGAALEDAARTLGATPWQAFARVTWPLLLRSLAPAILAVFTFAAGSYEIAALLGPSDPLPFPVLLYERHTDAALATRADADVLSLLALGAALAAVALHEWLRRRAEADLG